MKSFIKKILLVTSLLSIITCIKVDAETLNPPNVQLLGNAKNLVHIPGDEFFLYYPNMLPGDSIKRTLEIKNDYEYPYELSLKAKRVSEKETYDLLDKLDLKIIYKNKVIYEASANGENELTEGISLGTFNPGQDEKFIAEVTLDGPSTGNEYRDKVAQVDWIFTAIRKEETDSKKDKVTIESNKNDIKGEFSGNSNNNFSESTKTGDDSVFIYLILVLTTILLLIMSRKKDN